MFTVRTINADIIDVLLKRHTSTAHCYILIVQQIITIEYYYNRTIKLYGSFQYDL